MRVCSRYKNNRDDAVNLCNDAFLKIITNLQHINKNENLEAWIKRIATNTAIDDYRKHKNYSITVNLTGEAIPDYYDAGTNYNLPDEKLHANDLLKLIAQLKDPTKTVFNLFAIDGYSHKEIGEALDLTEEASRWHLNKARNMLKQKLNTLTQPFSTNGKQ